MRIIATRRDPPHASGSRLTVLSLGMLLLAWHAGLQAARMWTDAEVKAMPPYCAARYDGDANQRKHWGQVIGPDFMHTHHLCDGFGYLNRYTSERRPQKKKALLGSALGTLNYVLSHVQPSFPLLPVTYLTRARVYAYQQEHGKALADALKALELDPSLVEAYAFAAETYVKLGKKDDALGVVSAGLRHIPGNGALQRLYDNLGGKQPYPEPITPPSDKAASATSGTSGTSGGAAAGQPSGQPVKAEERGVQAPVEWARDAAGKAGGEAAATPARLGVPGNPWCRFCPEPAK